MSKENKERKEKALRILNSAIQSGAVLSTEDMHKIRNLIDPPISTLSRAEVESELESLRERVAHLENMDEYASELENKIDRMRNSIRVWAQTIKDVRDNCVSSSKLIGVIEDMDSELSKELDQ